MSDITTYIHDGGHYTTIYNVGINNFFHHLKAANRMLRLKKENKGTFV